MFDNEFPSTVIIQRTILVWEFFECQKMIFEYFHNFIFYYSNISNELKKNSFSLLHRDIDSTDAI